MEIPVTLSIPLIIAITIALVNRIKAEALAVKGIFSTLLSIGIGAGLYAISLYAPPVVVGFVFVGLAAAGVFDVYAKTGAEVQLVAVAGVKNKTII